MLDSRCTVSPQRSKRFWKGGREEGSPISLTGSINSTTMGHAINAYMYNNIKATEVVCLPAPGSLIMTSSNELNCKGEERYYSYNTYPPVPGVKKRIPINHLHRWLGTGFFSCYDIVAKAICGTECHIIPVEPRNNNFTSLRGKD